MRLDEEAPFRLDPDRTWHPRHEHGVRSYAVTDTGWTGQAEAFSPVEEARRQYAEEIASWTDVVNGELGVTRYPYGMVVELIESGEVVRLCHVQRDADG